MFAAKGLNDALHFDLGHRLVADCLCLFCHDQKMSKPLAEEKRCYEIVRNQD